MRSERNCGRARCIVAGSWVVVPVFLEGPNRRWCSRRALQARSPRNSPETHQRSLI